MLATHSRGRQQAGSYTSNPMARKQKPTAPPPANDALRDWRGFRARQRSPQTRLIAFVAVMALATLVIAGIGARVQRSLVELAMYGLIALQLLVVAESRVFFRGPWRWLVPLATAAILPVLLVARLDAPHGLAWGLTAVFTALILLPER